MTKKINEKHEKLIKKVNEIDKKLAEKIKDSLKDDINTPKGRKEFLKGKKILFACCFCTNGIENPQKESAIQIMKTKQIYWCHKKCIKNKMIKEASKLFQE